ncbi:1-acyl-sn-glycerol-3-phosphate acyltransferase [uncultured Gammaproteobacteria bacterium]
MIVFLRSLAFNIAFFTWMALASVLLSFSLLLPRPHLLAIMRWFLGSIAFLERTLAGIRYEVRGREHLPKGGCYLVGAKHQSAWETMKLLLLFDDPAVALKKELLKMPLWGSYARQTGMIMVDRAARTRALSSLMEGAQRVAAEGRQIVIFPQGTRTAPGTNHPYRVGIGLLYERLKVPIVPMALNSGLYWPRRSFIKYPGTIVIEFLPPIPPGLERYAAMIELEQRLEAATDRLVVEAGGPPCPPRPHPPESAGRSKGKGRTGSRLGMGEKNDRAV